MVLHSFTSSASAWSLILFLLIGLGVFNHDAVIVHAFSTARQQQQPEGVLVTGASGRTGQLVFEALLSDPRFAPKALVRSERSARALRRAVPATGLDQIVICDVTQDLLAEGEGGGGRPPSGLDGCQSMVICTSAVPRISKLSLVRAVLTAPWNVLRGKKAIDFRALRFVWKNGGYPEKVDYEGAVAQIDLAKQMKMKQVVVVSSMGGTDPSNFLNAVGKREDGTGNGDILLWKRKAERYLVEDTDLDYTIIHPGGLTDSAAGVEDFVLDVDDNLMQNKKRSISREDVANLCVASLVHGKGRKVSLDCITVAAEEGKTPKTADEAFTAFLKEQKTYNYAI